MAAIDPTDYTVTVEAPSTIVVDGVGFDPSEGSEITIKYTFAPDRRPDGTQPSGRSGSANGPFTDEDGTLHFAFPSVAAGRILQNRPGVLTISVAQTLGNTVIPVE